MDRKGQIGTTLTWAGAFVIIFFVLAVFAVASISLASTKRISVSNVATSSASNEISVGGQIYAAPDYKTSRDLYTFLASYTDKKRNMSMGEIVREYVQSNDANLASDFSKNAKTYFDSIYSSCYYLCVDPINKNNVKGIQVDGAKCVESASNMGLDYELQSMCSELRNHAVDEGYSQAKFTRSNEYTLSIYNKIVEVPNA